MQKALQYLCSLYTSLKFSTNEYGSMNPTPTSSSNAQSWFPLLIIPPERGRICKETNNPCGALEGGVRENTLGGWFEPSERPLLVYTVF
jgi:hypothetical protein